MEPGPDEMARTTSVVVADDHPVVRNGLRALVDSLDGLTVRTEQRPSARRSCASPTSSSWTCACPGSTAWRPSGGMLAADGHPLTVRIDVPRPLPELPAAVEVAAYRIVTEALTNVARHADARDAVVALDADVDRLRITVRDDGPVTAEWAPGVGLTSMRERAEALGGSFRAGGGCVEVALPL